MTDTDRGNGDGGVAAVDFAGELEGGAAFPGHEFHAVLERLRNQNRLARCSYHTMPVQLITRFEDLDAAFRNDIDFPAGPTYASSIEPCQGFTFESCDGPEHHQLRNLSTRLLRAQPVAQFAEQKVTALAHQVIDTFAHLDDVDLVPAFTAVFPFLVFGQRVGLPGTDQHTAARFFGLAFNILRYPMDNQTGLDAAAELTALAEPELAQRRGCPVEEVAEADLLGSMVAAEKDGRQLTDGEILSHVRALFSAGAATSHHGLGNTLYALLAHPEECQKLRDQPSLVPAAVDEMLRWEPPIGVLPRLVPNDVELAGQPVSANSIVLMGIASANRDERMYNNPHRFDVERRPSRLLTFGFGSHYCPGSHLAKAQIVVGVQALLDRFPKLTLADEPAARPNGAVMRGPLALPVKL